MADKLATLLRLRRLQADMARRDLGEALRWEGERRAALDVAIAAPRAEAAAVPGDAAAAFARWLPRAMMAIEACRTGLLEAEQARLVAAEAAGRRKAALEAVGQLQEERLQAARKLGLRRAQSGLDELTTNRFGR